MLFEHIIEEQLLALIVAGFALIGSPGPATLSLAAAGAAYGFKRGLSHYYGIIAGVFAVMVITATGVFGLVMALPGAALFLTLIAALYIAYLAFKIATAPPLSTNTESTKGPSFMGGFLLALANPKAYAAMAALYSGYGLVRTNPIHDAIAKTIVLVLIMVFVDICWLAFGSTLTRFIQNAKIHRVINVSFAIALVASIIFIMV